MSETKTEIVEQLRSGKVGVLLTDTIWGLVTQAENPIAVTRIYEIKGRTPTKPLIILISEIEDLTKFEIKLTNKQREKLEELWSNNRPTSVILDCPNERLTYIHRGTKTLAFRLPTPDNLRTLLHQTGPLVAPSANPEGYSPAENLVSAQAYFGDQVDFYIESDRSPTQAPSRLLRLFPDGQIEVIRP